MKWFVVKVFPLRQHFTNDCVGLQEKATKNKAKVNWKGESEQMATCHLTNRQNHSQLHHGIFPRSFLSPSSCLLSSMTCVHLRYKTHLAGSREQLGKQTNKKKKNQTSTFPDDSKILEAAATSSTLLGVTQEKKYFLFYKNIPCPQTGLQL